MYLFTCWFWQMSINHNPMTKEKTFTHFFLLVKVHKSGQKKKVLWMVYIWISPLYLIAINICLSILSLQWHHTLGISPQNNAFSHVQKHSPCLEELCPNNDNPKGAKPIPFFWYCFLAIHMEGLHIQ
jgi:hypothetical protein